MRIIRFDIHLRCSDHVENPDYHKKKKMLRSALHHAAVAAGTFEPRAGPSAAQMANQDWKNHPPFAEGSSTLKFVLGTSCFAENALYHIGSPRGRPIKGFAALSVVVHCFPIAPTPTDRRR